MSFTWTDQRISVTWIFVFIGQIILRLQSICQCVQSVILCVCVGVGVQICSQQGKHQTSGLRHGLYSVQCPIGELTYHESSVSIWVRVYTAYHTIQTYTHTATHTHTHTHTHAHKAHLTETPPFTLTHYISLLYTDGAHGCVVAHTLRSVLNTHTHIHTHTLARVVTGHTSTHKPE